MAAAIPFEACANGAPMKYAYPTMKTAKIAAVVSATLK
jgi:hypothetical protein